VLDIKRLNDMLGQMVHKELDRVSPLAVRTQNRVSLGQAGYLEGFFRIIPE
jgi:hypothetical protein